MAFEATCQGCGDAFEARRASAKWCSDRCRKAAGRRAKPKPPAAEESAHQASTGLIASVRNELEAAGRLDTFAGQLALQLAQRLTTPEESGISSLSKELRTVMATALEGHAPATGNAEPEPVEDEVEKARQARERKARQASG